MLTTTAQRKYETSIYINHSRNNTLYQCQSCCPAKAMVRIFLAKTEVEVDLCNHHYKKLRDPEHIILVDRRSEL